MTRQKAIEREQYIYALFFLFISKRGYFDYWLDEDLFFQIAQTAQCSPHLVKKIFFKKFYPDNQAFISNFEY